MSATILAPNLFPTSYYIYNLEYSDNKKQFLQGIVSQSTEELKCLMSLYYLRQNGVESQNTWKSFSSNDRTKKVVFGYLSMMNLN